MNLLLFLRGLFVRTNTTEGDEVDYGTGRIKDIIDGLKAEHPGVPVRDIPAANKLHALCESLLLTSTQLDNLIVDNSPVMRTVKGHAFEAFFDQLMDDNQVGVTEVGGDDAVDRVVNTYKLQLKTPTLAGTKGKDVQYKTHKTHGAKSEKESVDYYHKKDHFADFLVGLVSYEPLKILVLRREELPNLTNSPDHILSPFTLTWDGHPALNDFSRIGIAGQINHNNSLIAGDNELLPRCAKLLNLNSNVILNTILNEANFRIWDMAIRGFARETAFIAYLDRNDVASLSPSAVREDRADKSDHALKDMPTGAYYFLQMKGLSVNNCDLMALDPVVATETQLTRGRVNDHPTQSRLYLSSDFDFLIIGIDPPLSLIYQKSIGIAHPKLEWQFYAIPTRDLATHPQMPHRLKSLQKFKYKENQKYRIDGKWCERWMSTTPDDLLDIFSQ